MRVSVAILAAFGSATLVDCYETTDPAPLAQAATPMVVIAPQAPGAPAAAPPTGSVPQMSRSPVSPAAAALSIVIQPPTPVPLSPPPVPRAPAMVALPNLPHPSKYPHLPSMLAEKDVTECGVTWTGKDWMPTECVDPGLVTGQAKSARVVVPYTMMPPPAAALPALVDHRVDGTEGPVRRQVGPQCTAFALTSALDHAYARWTGKPGAFSIMQVYARYYGSSEDAAADGNVGALLGVEDDWPYDSPTASAWKRCHDNPATRKPGVRCGEPPDPAKIRELDANALVEITQIEVIPRGRLDVVREKLAGGQDVVAGARLHSYKTAGDPGARYVIGDENGKGIHGVHQHQILLAGYAMTPNGNYYLVHNSSGPKWGDDGYAWLHEDVLKAFSLQTDLVVPELQPTQVAELRIGPDGGPRPRCPPGEVPDSISAMCARVCPDGSPRHNNVCAESASQCPAGTINLTGACLMAAPPSAGVEPATGVRWTCGPGGCSYDIPGGVLGCKQAACAVSCPAPAFRLATTPRGIACVE